MKHLTGKAIVSVKKSGCGATLRDLLLMRRAWETQSGCLKGGTPGRKEQIQALNRTQPGLPLKKGRCGTMTHDYKGNGTTTLVAALNIPYGQVIGECHTRRRHQEWLRFLRRLEREFPSKLKLHLVMDNYGTHSEPHVQRWLKKHPRFICHFVPTSSSWLNLVERWFRELTDKTIRRGSFVSVPDLKPAIDEFLTVWNDAPKPFIWTATVHEIVEKIARARAKMEQLKPGSSLVGDCCE
jgi:hypothetical protein